MVDRTLKKYRYGNALHKNNKCVIYPVKDINLADVVLKAHELYAKKLMIHIYKVYAAHCILNGCC